MGDGNVQDLLIVTLPRVPYLFGILLLPLPRKAVPSQTTCLLVSALWAGTT